MKKYDLSILIPSRNEMFAAKTVETVLKNKRGKTEILIGLDGQWADPGIADHEDVTLVYYPESIGQRAMTNQLCKLSHAKYVMKLDAHTNVDEGFDVKLMADMQDDWTVVPLMKNLHAFDWVCPDGHRRYQSPSGVCKECGKETTRDIVWIAKDSPKSTSFCFDTTMHFQYFKSFEKRLEGKSDLSETFSLQGSCFMLTREKYWELNICDEQFGSWGQQGVEVALKTWLSGGKVICNKKTWYAHMFRTQGGDFGFPYPISGKQVDHARKFSRELFFENTWPQQIHPLSWLLEKFSPVPYWYVDAGDKKADKEMLAYVMKRGEEFYISKAAKQINNLPADEESIKNTYDRGELNHLKPLLSPSKNIIFYTDNLLKLRYAHVVQDSLRKVGIPIVSASLKPMDHFGKNLYIPMQRGIFTYFTQIIAALEHSDAEIVYMCEHDVIYHPSHFDFIPPRKDTFYYNINFWRIRPEKDNLAVHWDAHQVSGLVAYRQLVLDWYKNKVEDILKKGFDRSYEPGGRTGENWKSEFPNIDIRHGGNLTKSKWSLADFRDKSTSAGWEESTLEQIPGWDIKKLLHL